MSESSRPAAADRDSLRGWASSTAGRTVFGRGAAALTGDAVSSLGRRAFVCTDDVLMKLEVVDLVLRALDEAGVETVVFAGGEPEVSRSTVEAAYEIATTANPDVVVGVGGGSNLDLAKGVALLLAHGGELSDYFGESKVPGPTIPVVAVPTTAGTGSEVSPVAVFTDTRRKLKAGISSHYLVPAWAIVDPTMTALCPPSVTAHSGLDALSHAIEAICAIDHGLLEPGFGLDRVFCGRSPYSDALAQRAIELIGLFLVRAVDDGADELAREQMMLASLLAGMAFGSAGTGLVHALQYPVGAATGTAHGLGNAILMPAVMQFNSSVREQELARVYRSLTRDLEPDDRRAADAAPAAVRQLAARLGIPDGLRAIGVRDDDLTQMAEDAMSAERLVRLNPRQATKDDLRDILAVALDPFAHKNRT
jgi:alcohol dehydrogenase class IV